MNINEKHHQRRISTSRRVNIIGQSNFSITFTLRQRGKGTGTEHRTHFRTSATPAMGSNIVPRRHTQLRTHARTNETNTISRLDSPPNLRLLLTLLRLLLLLLILILLLLLLLVVTATTTTTTTSSTTTTKTTTTTTTTTRDESPSFGLTLELAYELADRQAGTHWHRGSRRAKIDGYQKNHQISITKQ